MFALVTVNVTGTQASTTSVSSTRILSSLHSGYHQTWSYHTAGAMRPCEILCWKIVVSYFGYVYNSVLAEV